MTYAKVHVRNHWIGFALIVVMAVSGLTYRYELAGDGAMRLHFIAGQLLIVALIIRILRRLTTPPSPSAIVHSELERRIAQIVQIGLYLCMIAFVITGYISASAEIDAALIYPVSLAFARSDLGEQILELHYSLKWVLLGLVSLHVAGALKHHFWDKDTTLTDMTFKARQG